MSNQNLVLFFDTETTGLPRDFSAPASDVDNWPRIVQVGWVVAEFNGTPVGETEYIIRPEGFEVSATAASIHGITTERALAEGVDGLEVLTKLAKAIDRCDLIVAHNMGFDIKVVGAEFIRRGITNSLREKAAICTMLETTRLCKLPSRKGPGFYKWPKLTELHEFLFGESFEGAHSALVDIKATERCFFELVYRGNIKLPNIPDVQSVETEPLRCEACGQTIK